MAKIVIKGMQRDLYYVKNGIIYHCANPLMYGDYSGLYGNCTDVVGDCTGKVGNAKKVKP